MNEALTSEHWYRVAPVRLQLRAGTQISRHRYRGRTWYLLRDATSGETVRINRPSHELLRLLDGDTPLDRAYEMLRARLGETAPSQDEVILAIAQLAEAGLLQTDRPTDLAQLKHGARLRRRREWASRVNPFAFQVALFDPSRQVDLLAPWTGGLFSRPALLLLAAMILVAAAIVAVNGAEIGAEIARVSAERGFLLMSWLVYPVAKAVHEFAHAIAARRFGGDVREMGVRMLLLMPMPYVDASSASMFSDKRERAIVAGAGIAAELAIAAFAVFAWALLEPGSLRDLALVAALVTSISTVLFNGNPLLKFDGYFVLTDLLELPNLAVRSRQMIKAALQRRLLRIDPVDPPEIGPGERPWLVGYGLASWLYRLFLFCSIALVVASVSVPIGLAVLGWGLWTLVLRPVLEAGRFVLTHPALSGRRLPTVALGGVGAAALAAALLVPVPASTTALGVVWLPEHAHVRPEVGGRLVRFLAAPGAIVRAGQPLLELRNEDLELAVIQHETELQALRAEYLDKLNRRSPQAIAAGEAIKAKREELAQARRRLDALVVLAGTGGRFVVPRASDHIGAWFEQGESIAFLLHAPDTTIRVAVPNAMAARVRDNTESVRVVMTESPDLSLPAALRAELGASVPRLPSAALGTTLGGWIETDPSDPEGLRVFEPVFVMDVTVENRPVMRAGQRALVRFSHPDSPIALQAHDLLRRLFLRHFFA